MRPSVKFTSSHFFIDCSFVWRSNGLSAALNALFIFRSTGSTGRWPKQCLPSGLKWIVEKDLMPSVFFLNQAIRKNVKFPLSDAVINVNMSEEWCRDGSCLSFCFSRQLRYILCGLKLNLIWLTQRHIFCKIVAAGFAKSWRSSLFHLFSSFRIRNSEKFKIHPSNYDIPNIQNI